MRLLPELAFWADASGHTVLSGSATELERDLPFSVFVDALDDYVQALDPRRLELLDGDARAEPAMGASSIERRPLEKSGCEIRGSARCQPRRAPAGSTQCPATARPPPPRSKEEP